MNDIRIYIRGLFMVLLLLQGLTGYATPPGYAVRNFNSEETLEKAYVYSISQDSLGYLWIGTGDGLVRYNGYVFQTFTTGDSLADNFVTWSINEGSAMWFGHMNGEVSLFNGKNFQAIPTGLSDPGPVTCMTQSSDSAIWMSTYGGNLVRLDRNPGNIRRFSFREAQAIISFAFIDEKSLLVGTDNGLLVCELTHSEGIQVISLISDVPLTKISNIIRKKHGRGFFVATESDGIYDLTDRNNGFAVIKVNKKLELTGIQSIYEDRNSDLWVCTLGKGIIKIPSDSNLPVTLLNSDNGYVSDNVKSFFEDREGNFWCGNYGDGVSQLTKKAFHLYTFDETRYGSNISSIQIKGNFIWAGTEKGILKLDHHGTIQKYYGTENGLPENKITALVAAGEDIWMGTENFGVYLLKEKSDKVLHYPIAEGQLENSITSMAVVKEHIWIGTKRGLCSVYPDKGSIKWFTISQGGLPHNFIHGLFIDVSGRLWISSRSNSLAYILNDRVFRIALNSGDAASLGPFVQDTDSLLWVGSLGNGTYRIADTTFNLTQQDGLLSDYCYSMAMDGSKHLWIGHKGGLSKIRTRDFFVKTILQPDDQKSNYTFNPNAMAADSYGTIWMGSAEGLISYDSRMELSDPPPLVPHIISLNINDEEKEFRHSILLKPGKYKIKLEYFAVSLKDPELTTYKIKLAGQDLSTEITQSRTVTYNLSEGKYTFYLQAISGDGISSKHQAVLEIIIKTPLWKRGGFYPALALILLLFVFLYIKRSQYRFRAEKSKLEKMVLERTREINNQKNEIELQRDLIHTKNTEITSSIRYAMSIQTAVLPSQSMLDSLLPENFIYLRPKDIVSGDFYWISKKNDKIIFTVADCTGHGVPGAFMSLLSITMLNEIVNVQGITQSDDIVNQLNSMINLSLNKSRMDGMDLSLCVLDPRNNQLEFTGAMNHLVYIRDGQIELIKADHFSVNALRDDFRPFSRKLIHIQKGDMFYLYSDGYADQFGGNKDKKLTIKRFYDILMEIHQLPLAEQEVQLEERLLTWKRDGVQTDDITVMGIRF